MGVIDEAVLVAVLAGQHAGTAGATDGVGYEAIGETYASFAMRSMLGVWMYRLS